MSFNIIKTGLLLAAMSGVLVAMGGLIGGQMGMLIALGIAAVMNVFSYWNSDKLVLRMHGAKRVDKNTAPEFYNMVEVMARNAGLPMPAVYIMENDQPNAFATGRNPENSAVAATTGLLNRLTREEVAGVMAHELAHIKNRDTLIMTVAATIAGAIGMLANMLQFQMLFGGTRDNNNPLGWIGLIAAMFLAPMAAMIVQMAISRTREYKADRVGAEICGNPLWLASALQSIQAGANRIPNEPAEAAPATAHMFIINPLMGRRFDNLFSTHPNTQNRVAELEAFAREIGITNGTSGPGQFATEPNHGRGPWDQQQPPSGTDHQSRGPWG